MILCDCGIKYLCHCLWSYFNCLGYSPGETSSSYLPSPSTLLSPSDFSPSPFHPVIFDNLDGVLVRCTILRMDGAAGPSGLDVTSWKKLCTCFKNASNTLCDALSAVARRLATTFHVLILSLLVVSLFWINILVCNLLELVRSAGGCSLRQCLVLFEMMCCRLLAHCSYVLASLRIAKLQSMQ